VRQPDDPELDGLAVRYEIEGESAEMFWIGEGGRLALFRSEFTSATWDEKWHDLTISTSKGTITLRDELWGK
jgi:hypothetical protein